MQCLQPLHSWGSSSWSTFSTVLTVTLTYTYSADKPKLLRILSHGQIQVHRTKKTCVSIQDRLTEVIVEFTSAWTSEGVASEADSIQIYTIKNWFSINFTSWPVRIPGYHHHYQLHRFLTTAIHRRLIETYVGLNQSHHAVMMLRIREKRSRIYISQGEHMLKTLTPILWAEWQAHLILKNSNNISPDHPQLLRQTPKNPAPNDNKQPIKPTRLAR